MNLLTRLTPFFALVRKDLVLYRSDRRALLLNLVVPIVLASFFGYLFGGTGTASPGKIDMAVVQLDESDISRKIVAGLKADPALNLIELDLAQAQARVKAGKLKAAVVLPQGFGDAAGDALFIPDGKPVIDILYDPSETAVLSMVKGMLTQQVMQTVTAEMFGGKSGIAFADRNIARLEAQAGNDPQSQALKEFLHSVRQFESRTGSDAGEAGQDDTGKKSAGGLSMPYTIHDQALTSGKTVKGYNGYAHAFAGMGVQFILFMGIDMGIGILLAQRSGVWNRLLAAPVSMGTVLLARATAAAVIAFFLMSVLFLFAMLLFKVEVANPLGFVGITVCFALLTASFGLLIAAYGKTPEAARSLATFATLIMVMLGGAWVPSFLFPQWVQQVTFAVPTRWAIDGFDAMTWRGLGMDAAFTAMGAELAFAAVFALLAVLKFRKNA